MIRLQTRTTNPSTRSAAGRQIRTAALFASASLIVQILSACSDLHQISPETSGAAEYPNMNDPTPTAEVREDQVARIKAELIQVRDNQVRAAIQQQAFR
jgi:hypothetical protein